MTKLYRQNLYIDENSLSSLQPMQKRQKHKREIADLKESMKMLQAKEEMARAEKDVLRWVPLKQAFSEKKI